MAVCVYFKFNFLFIHHQQVKMKDLKRYRECLDPNNKGKIEFSSLLLLCSKDVERLEQKSPIKKSSSCSKQPKMDLRPRESLNLPQRFLK